MKPRRPVGAHNDMSELPPQPSAPVVVLAVGAVVLLVLMIPMCYCCLMFLCRHVFTSAPTTPAELVSATASATATTSKAIVDEEATHEEEHSAEAVIGALRVWVAQLPAPLVPAEDVERICKEGNVNEEVLGEVLQGLPETSMATLKHLLWFLWDSGTTSLPSVTSIARASALSCRCVTE